MAHLETSISQYFGNHTDPRAARKTQQYLSYIDDCTLRGN